LYPALSPRDAYELFRLTSFIEAGWAPDELIPQLCSRRFVEYRYAVFMAWMPNLDLVPELRWTTRPGSPARVHPSLHLALLLALVPTYCFGLDRHGKLPNPRAIRALARQFFKQLFPPKIL